MGITQLDLSPYYLAEARQNLKYWRSMRGGPSPADTSEAEDGFLQAPAENIPLPDNSVDAVSTQRRRMALSMSSCCQTSAQPADVVKVLTVPEYILQCCMSLCRPDVDENVICSTGDFHLPVPRDSARCAAEGGCRDGARGEARRDCHHYGCLPAG